MALAVVCVLLVIYVFQGESIRDYARQETASAVNDPNLVPPAPAPEEGTVDPELESTQDKNITTYSFDTESKKVTRLAAELPGSKPELIAIITQEDIYKKREVKPHSLDELTQNQMGAVKVMALRALMSKDAHSKVIKQDLNLIIQSAKDPTIVKIAKAAQESLDKGRPFFDDFLQALSDMPLE